MQKIQSSRFFNVRFQFKRYLPLLPVENDLQLERSIQQKQQLQEITLERNYEHVNMAL